MKNLSLYMKLNTLLLAIAALCLTACGNQNVRETVRNIAEQQVDTTGYESRQLQLAPFSALTVSCFADVTYHQSDAFRIEVQAPKSIIDKVEAKVDDEELEIGLKRMQNQPHNTVAVIHVYAPTVNDFALNGAKCLRLGNVKLSTPVKITLAGVGIVTAEKLKATRIEADLEGAGNIDLRGIDTPSLNAALEGAGNITLSGKAKKARVELNGTGNIDVSKLQTQEKMDSHVNGVGNIVTKS